MKLLLALLLVVGLPAPVTPLKAGSKALQKLLSKSRRLNDEVDMTWVANYSIQFDQCHSLIQVGGEEQQNNGGSMIYTYNLVTFHLCPSDSCATSSKNTGCAQYVVGMDIFVDMYTETKLEEQEAACEAVRENCNADDDGGEDQCYIDAGLEDCIEVEGGEEFEVQRYLECAEMDVNNNNNNQNYNANANKYAYNQYFIGPHCSSDGKSIHLAIFYDEGCSAKATETDIYSTLNGKELPFSSESMVKNDCISCKEVEEDDGNNNNNNNDEADEDQVIEFCETLYESAGKCETNIASTAAYPDESACEYINKILPRLEANSKSISSGSSSGGTAAKAFAWVFAFTTVALGVYAFLLFRKLRRSKTNLSEQGLGDQGGEMN